MPQDQFRSASTPVSRTGLWTTLGMTAAVLFFLISGAVSFSNVQVLKTDNEKIVHSHEVIAALDAFLSTMQDAETGQRLAERLQACIQFSDLLLRALSRPPAFDQLFLKFFLLGAYRPGILQSATCLH